jgi:tetratricopeptide (TPR) repeat protein
MGRALPSKLSSFLPLVFLSCWLVLPGDLLFSQESQAPLVLLQDADRAYRSSNWPEAVRLFTRFLETYGADPALTDPSQKIFPLLALSHFRQGAFDAAKEPAEKALADPRLEPLVRAELRFFSALGSLTAGHHEEARAHLGAVFSDPKVDPARRMESLILGGTSYVMEENWSGAITFFERHGREIRQSNPEAGGRADLLHLHSLMKAEQWDQAILLAQDVATRIDQVRQVVTFSSLLIALGSQFLTDGHPYKAIAVLRLVRSRAEILALQQAKLSAARADLAYAKESHNPVRENQIGTSIREMEVDLEKIEAMPEFDSASRLRLAQAYSDLGRPRETSLILDQMVRQMPPDELVESATVNLICGWMSLDRWSRASRAADVYLERLGHLPLAKHIPGVLFAKAQACEGQLDHAKAAEIYADMVARFPGHELAFKARFLQAYNKIQLEDHAGGGALLDALLKDMPTDNEMWEHAFFWRAMADYFDQKWDPAREQLGRYLERISKKGGAGLYRDDAIFRIGYAYFSEALYQPAIREMTRLEKEEPTSEWLPEALLTLGDACSALGELDQALLAYRRIPPEAVGFHDEGWMKCGQIFKARKDLEGMRTLFEDFLKLRRDSSRIAEALHWLGWIAKQQGNPEQARKISWDALRRLGNDEARPGIEEIFLGLAPLYPGPERKALETALQQERVAAETGRQTHYLVRLGWAEAQLSGGSGSLEGRTKLGALATRIEPKDTSPRILVDCAEALATLGKKEEAARLFQGLRKWYPRAPERDRAYAGLGFLALDRGEQAEALAQFDRFERTTVMPKSAPGPGGISIVEAEIGGKVALARARLLEPSDADRALQVYTAVQKSKSLPSRLRAEALLGAAELQVRRNRFRESLPLFEQVYVLFNRHPELVAQAYWGRGQALEGMGSRELAREVYSELACRQDLQKTKQAADGRTRAIALGGVIQPAIPEGGEIPPKPRAPQEKP